MSFKYISDMVQAEERPMLNTKSSWCDARCPGMKSPNLGQTPFSQSYSHRSAGHGESGDGGNFEGTRGDWRWTGAQNLDSTTAQLTAQNPTDQREAILKGCTFFLLSNTDSFKFLIRLFHQRWVEAANAVKVGQVGKSFQTPLCLYWKKDKNKLQYAYYVKCWHVVLATFWFGHHTSI